MPRRRGTKPLPGARYRRTAGRRRRWLQAHHRCPRRTAAGYGRSIDHAPPHSASGRPHYEDLSIGQLVLKNRPWRLVRDLSKVLVAILGSAGFFVVNTNAWAIADQQDVTRLVVIAVVALVGLGAWLVVAHSLWEDASRTPDPQLMRRINVATVLTLLLGLVFAYVVLYAVVLAAMALVVPSASMASNLSHDAAFEDYAAAAWFATSMAIVVGAIGSGLESDDEVRETISRYRPPSPAPQDQAVGAGPSSTSDD
ncbi:hypothetical protein [Conexibacter sp. SYSU D00693]|uniref:hypothetical protein n=1 Tax=Conexibacter sp. SYSU D00693 TaxID=2812560 RepID=UPI00196ACEF3|nr:hypothetical protein [Conexibacter sp. SYSU D00693]